jgi:hypothetical protein
MSQIAELHGHAVATEKTAAGIGLYHADALKLEQLMATQL